ncbi:endonuclease/exonuclease/phosphatase family protein [Ornithinimicrobium murale]|uniref:endonuclease/exonuclease/phosphatase family protein n=1 Tax=Ornithinimicrobium murale TaxID=1050153 RepID=UPI001EDDB4C0|nr:endonuclease/exonuclease/phosphatase family protein [Ornithinimicrobium murale]
MRDPRPPAPMPDHVAADLAGLRAALADQVVPKTADNLLIGTWNIRALSRYTDKWTSQDSDSPKRDWHALAAIAEVIRCFDVTAIQETRRDTSALFALLSLLGEDYRVIASDVTEGDQGNDERLAYLYDSSRVQPSGLVGEIVLPPQAEGEVKQFARTPYAAGFVRSGVEFILTTVHVLWGKKPADRLPELTAFAEWMRSWADRPKDWNRNLMVLGDFNIDRHDDPLWQAFFSTGLYPPAVLHDVPRTIFDDDREHHFYDQISWFTPTLSDGRTISRLEGIAFDQVGGNVDFVPHVLTDADLTRSQMSWRISDHYPLWLEFHVGG